MAPDRSACEPLIDDGRLAERAASGDRAAFAQLVRQHQEGVARIARRLLGWDTEVEDVVQEVFVAMLRHLPEFRGDCRLGTWLYRITVNECRRRRRGRLLRLRCWWGARVTADGEGGAERTALRKEAGTRVRAAVAALPHREREVVVLRYLEGLAVADVGEVLGLSRNAVDVRLCRARDRLRRSLAGLMED